MITPPHCDSIWCRGNCTELLNYRHNSDSHQYSTSRYFNSAVDMQKRPLNLKKC